MSNRHIGSAQVDHKIARKAKLPRDLVCYSHLRWDFVFQRPQQLMTRFAREQRVTFVEEPAPDATGPRLEVRPREAGVIVVTPRLTPDQLAVPALRQNALRVLLERLLAADGIHEHVAWYYTPMALADSAHLAPTLVVYDCMDELSGFKGAPPDLVARERELFARADLVFTGGQRLYEAKRTQHPRVLCFPSSVDAAHFARARAPLPAPADQRDVPRPRLGYAGVIDERIDLALLAELAAARPDFSIVMLGPVVKIDPATLPRAPNLHYLGMKPYTELPAYLSGWDIGLLPFARNAATEFISPTKTPEYLAAGLPVIATPIRDVVRSYGDRGLAAIAPDARGFIAAAEAALASDRVDLRSRADRLLATMSWDRTSARMRGAIIDRLSERGAAAAADFTAASAAV